MKNIILKGIDICKRFENGTGKTYALNHTDIEIYEGDFTVIMGSSGAGKSTLLYALSGMDKITEGKIEYKNKEINVYGEKEMSKLRGEDFGFIFQQSNLISNMTLYENICISGFIGNKNEEEVLKKADKLVNNLNIENAKNRFPSQVSGGETQRAAVARALINEPNIIFADEPTGALNKANTTGVLNILSEINKKGQSILMVTHDLRCAVRGNRILYMEDGKIINELILANYNIDSLKEREEKINGWLSALRW